MLPIKINKSEIVDGHKLMRFYDLCQALPNQKFVEEVFKEFQWAVVLIEDLQNRLVEMDMKQKRAEKLQTFCEITLNYLRMKRITGKEKIAESMEQWLIRSEPQQYFQDSEKIRNEVIENVKWCYRQLPETEPARLRTRPKITEQEMDLIREQHGVVNIKKEMERIQVTDERIEEFKKTM